MGTDLEHYALSTDKAEEVQVVQTDQTASCPTLLPSRPGNCLRLITLMIVVVLIGVFLFPALFSADGLIGTSQPPVVISTGGQVAFSSSGQLDPFSQTGLNDLVTLSL